MAKEENPMDQLSVVMEKLAELAKGIGLNMEGFAFIPKAPGQQGPHLAQAMFVLDPEVAFVDAEERRIKKEFDEMALRMRVEEDQEKAQSAAEKLQATLRDLSSREGIGLDEGADDE